MTPSPSLHVENKNSIMPVELSADALPYLTLVQYSSLREEKRRETDRKSRGRA